MVRHISPPIEDDFEYSRDKVEENVAALLRDPVKSGSTPVGGPVKSG